MAWLSAYWDNRKKYCDIIDEYIRQNLKFASTEIDYFGTRGIPVDNVDSHSLHSDGMAISILGQQKKIL